MELADFFGFAEGLITTKGPLTRAGDTRKELELTGRLATLVADEIYLAEGGGSESALPGNHEPVVRFAHPGIRARLVCVYRAECV